MFCLHKYMSCVSYEFITSSLQLLKRWTPVYLNHHNVSAHYACQFTDEQFFKKNVVSFKNLIRKVIRKYGQIFHGCCQSIYSKKEFSCTFHNNFMCISIVQQNTKYSLKKRSDKKHFII